MRIRELRPADVEALVDELWRPFAEEMAALDPYNALTEGVRGDALAYRRDQLDDPDVAVFVADDGGLVGYATVEYAETPPVFERGPEGHVSELYVAPEHRRRGVGGALMDAAEAWARERGCERATLSVNAANGPARRLYEERGYAVRRHKMDTEL